MTKMTNCLVLTLEHFMSMYYVSDMRNSFKTVIILTTIYSY